MPEYESFVLEEITETLDSAAFENLTPDSFQVVVTDSFHRKLGECRPVQRSLDGSDPRHYRVRIARRLFEEGADTDWRDTVRHEVADAYVFSEYRTEVQPHRPRWKDAARRAGANPTVRYGGMTSLMQISSLRVWTVVSSVATSSGLRGSSTPGGTSVRSVTNGW